MKKHIGNVLDWGFEERLKKMRRILATFDNDDEEDELYPLRSGVQDGIA